MESRQRIIHFDQHAKQEIATENWLPERPLTIGLTAGASCPNNLIEEAILRLYELHGISVEQLLSTTVARN
jgi:4-hydroxy-3-methylbut-2-enyl diphosphate reductase